jgi:peptide/nickel transport system permease protein
MRRNKALIWGSFLLLLLMMLTFIGPLLPIIDQDLERETLRYDENRKMMKVPFPPSEQNLLGTDGEGVDLLSLIVMGAKETLLIVFVIAVVRYSIAIPIGIAASSSSGVIYWLVYKWNQIFSALPTLFAAILFIRMPFIVISENRTLWVILILALLEVGRVSYIIHQQVHSLSKTPFVESGRMVGNTALGIYRRYFMPYLIPQIIINFVLDLGKIMLLLGQLGFLSIFISQIFMTYDIGVGMLVNQTNTWPQLLANSRGYIRTDFWIPFWPSMAIAFTIITFNLFGEGLRQHFEKLSSSKYNPKLEKQVMQEITLAKENKKMFRQQQSTHTREQ